MEKSGGNLSGQNLNEVVKEVSNIVPETSASDIIDSDIIMNLKQYVEEYKFEIFIGFVILLVILMSLNDKGIIDLDFLGNLFSQNLFEKLESRHKYILEHSLMVHLEDDELSQKRMKDVSKIYKQYDLPLNTFKALHWKKDKEELDKMPLDYDKIVKEYSEIRPGSYGLAGSFLKCLLKAVQENWSYLLFLEDDSIPILTKDKFYPKFGELMNDLPDQGEGIFMLGVNVHCDSDPNDTNHRWLKHSQIKEQLKMEVYGAHAVLISQKYIHLLFQFILKNKIDDSIDNFINKMNPWFWWGDLSENGMFRGLYQQYNTNCNDRESIINNSRELNK